MNNTIKINAMTESQIQAIGINALKEKLGVVGTLRFLEHYDNGGSGDYTAEKYKHSDSVSTKEEILKMFE